MPAAPHGIGGSSALQHFFGQDGWQEVGILGIGAQGPVLLVSHGDFGAVNPKRSALKRSSADEIRALSALSQCRNIVTLEEHFKGDNLNEVWARLEWLEGGSLRGLLRSEKPGKLSEDAARFLLGEVLFGLQEIHQLRWMHRDVKAENIGLSMPVVTESGQAICRVKLLDFDTAVPVARGEELTEVVGTVENMAPEVFDGLYDERADCWSLGVVAYEMLFGYRPFNDACIDRVEEMVKNWRRYLMVPSDAGAAQANFVTRLLSAQKDRMSSSEASAHHWLRSVPGGASGPRCTAAAATAISSATGRKGSTCGVPPAAMLQHAAAKADATASPERRASMPAVLSVPDPLPLSKVPRRSSVSAGEHVDERDAVESLSRIRRSLSEWSAPSLGTVFSSSSSGNANARLAPSAVSANAKSKGSQTARPLERAAQLAAEASAITEAAAKRRGSDAEGSGSFSAVPSQRLSQKCRTQSGTRVAGLPKTSDNISDSGHVGGSNLTASGMDGIEEEYGSIDLTPAPKGVSGHLDYLCRVRSRTQEVVEMAEAMAARHASSSSASTRPAPASSLSAAAAPSTASVAASSPAPPPIGISAGGAHNDNSIGAITHSGSPPRRNLHAYGGDVDGHRFPTDSIFRYGDDTRSDSSPIEHLECARARTKELLSRLSIASEAKASALPDGGSSASTAASPAKLRGMTTEALPQHSQLATAAELHSQLLRESRHLADARGLDPELDIARQSARSSSPNTWLAEQRSRIESKLGRLRRASAQIEDVAVAAEGPAAAADRWAGHVAGHLPPRTDMDAGSAWPTVLRQHMRQGDAGSQAGVRANALSPHVWV